MHVRSHTDLPGFIAKGNLKANALDTPVQLFGQPNIFQQAKLSHQHFHQNIPRLVCQYYLRQDQLFHMPKMPRDQHAISGIGINPRELGVVSCGKQTSLIFPSLGG